MITLAPGRTLLALVAALVALPAAAPAQRAAGAPPNIVLIVADDLGYGDLGSYGQTRIRTPHLDRMAREGTRFTQFYAGSPVCAPSRSALMTGQHTGHTPIRGNREHPEGQEPLPAASVTLAEVLKQAGYATGAAGKWGLGGPGTEGAPWLQGFDYFFGYLDQRRAHFYFAEWLHRNQERVALPNRVREEPRSPGAGPAVVRGRYTHDVIAEEALAFVERNRDWPFLLYVPFTIPHAELQAPDSMLRLYRDAEGRSVFPETPFEERHYGAQPTPRAAYAAMVSTMDRDVGRILDRLRLLGLDHNTLVLFTSDNGPSVEGGSDPAFFNSSGGLRGVKRDLYEGGIRVPMLAWWPGRVPAGRVSDQVWALWDLLPTLAELTGTRAPADIDGISMVAALTGRGAQRQHDHLYWEFYEQGSRQAVRMGRWKAVRQPMLTGPVELYDLQSDPAEQRDVAAGHPELVERARRLMERAHTPSPIWTVPARRAAHSPPRSRSR